MKRISFVHFNSFDRLHVACPSFRTYRLQLVVVIRLSASLAQRRPLCRWEQRLVLFSHIVVEMVFAFDLYANDFCD